MTASVLRTFLLVCIYLKQSLGTPIAQQSVENIPVAIEWDRSRVNEEVTAGGNRDDADIQNTEDDPAQIQVECSPGVQYMRDPRDCSKFYQCSNGVPYHMGCEAGLNFNLDLKVCTWASNVECDLDRCDRRRIGRVSGTDDGAQSTARCPDGYLPVSCTSSDPRRSDGAFIDGRNCVVVNGERGRGQRAIATCVSSIDSGYVFLTSSGPERDPSIQCPSGYRVINCLIRNQWNDIQFAFPAIDVSRNSCSSDVTCLAGWGCTVQAICRKI